MLHLLGGIFWHHLRCFLRTGNWTGTRTGIRSVQCTVGILPVAEYDATHSHIGGTHLNLYMEAKKTKTTVKKEENRMCRFKSNISNNAEESPRTNVCADRFSWWLHWSFLQCRYNVDIFFKVQLLGNAMYVLMWGLTQTFMTYRGSLTLIKVNQKKFDFRIWTQSFFKLLLPASIQEWHSPHVQNRWTYPYSALHPL